jgi:hypothetical protein
MTNQNAKQKRYGESGDYILMIYFKVCDILGIILGKWSESALAPFVAAVKHTEIACLGSSQRHILTHLELT